MRVQVFKGKEHPKPNLWMFWALSKDYHFFKNNVDDLGKLPEKLKMSLDLKDSAVLEL